jgi:uncharacterized protein (DUF1499 family)
MHAGYDSMTEFGMLFRPTNPLSHRLARLAFIAACAAALCVGLAGPLYRYAGIELDGAIGLFRYGFYVGAGAVALGLATIVPTRPGERRRGFLAAALSVAIGLGAAAMPLKWFLDARSVPRINDVTSDTADPPALVQTLQLRQDAVTSPTYDKDFAAEQRAHYPDIGPILLKVPPADAFRKVDKVAMDMGWDVVARAPAEGRLEAIATTNWFGFHDDIVVRIRAEGDGSRVDIRSKSRVGRSDLGVNARRIRDFTARLRSGD